MTTSPSDLQSWFFDHRVLVAQGKIRTFVEACGGTATLRALRMYIETQERNDAVISRALIASDGGLAMGRLADGTPSVSLAAS